MIGLVALDGLAAAAAVSVFVGGAFGLTAVLAWLADWAPPGGMLHRFDTWLHRLLGGDPKDLP